MNAREPLKITPAAMMAKGEKKPDEDAEAFGSHPEPDLLRIHDPEKFGCSPGVIKAMVAPSRVLRKLMETTSTG